MSKANLFFKKNMSRIINWAYEHIALAFDSARADRAVRRLQNRRRQENEPIKVGFVVQMPEVWNKEAPVYESMGEDPRFDPWLIIVPEKKLTKKSESSYGKELSYFTSLYPEGKFLTSKDLSADFSKMKHFSFDYIFFQRCWESYLPESLRTRKVIQFAKTCYVPYYYPLHYHSTDYYNTRFFKSLYIQFGACKEEVEEYQPKGLRKSKYYGAPYLSKIQPTYRAATRTSILWTPRWEDKQFGGTSFYDYKDRFLELKRKHADWNIVLRPHPLTFQEAIRTSRMTEDEIERFYQQNLDAGVVFDDNANIDDSLKETSILISDSSSILIDAFLAEIPLIFCEKHASEKRTDTFAKILECSYVAHSWNDVERYLSMLVNGCDPLREKRSELASEIRKCNKGAYGILEFIAQDAGC